MKKKMTDAERKARKTARNKAYYEANKEKIAAQQKAYYEANKEKIAARQKVYRAQEQEALGLLRMIGEFSNLKEALK